MSGNSVFYSSFDRPKLFSHSNFHETVYFRFEKIVFCQQATRNFFTITKIPLKALSSVNRYKKSVSEMLTSLQKFNEDIFNASRAKPSTPTPPGKDIPYNGFY